MPCQQTVVEATCEPLLHGIFVFLHAVSILIYAYGSFYFFILSVATGM